MDRDWAATDWATLGLELDHRAKSYSISGKLISESANEGVILFQSLKKKILDSGKVTSWESIFEPLVWKLLKENNVLWVCLGHFTGDRSNSKRRWLYYFSKDLSYTDQNCQEQLEDFSRAFRAMSFNANYKEKAGSSLLMTSHFLEILSSRHLKNDSEYSLHGSSLVVSLQ